MPFVGEGYFFLVILPFFNVARWGVSASGSSDAVLLRFCAIGGQRKVPTRYFAACCDEFVDGPLYEFYLLRILLKALGYDPAEEGGRELWPLVERESAV